jgi:predicted Zn finger-like uncharacterized protein
MSLVTSCPDCGTVFKVRTEHLSAHCGDVRCGKCSFVFNALNHLAETNTHKEQIASGVSDEHQAAPPVEWTILEVPQDDQQTAFAEAEPITAIDSTIDAVSASPNEILSIEPALPEKNEAEIQASNQETVTTPEVSPWEATASLATVGSPSAEVLFDSPETQPEAGANNTDPDIPQFNQVPSDPRPAMSSWLLGALAMTLLALCLGQIAYSLRTGITARYPPSRPYLLSFCELAGCIVELPQRASLLAIEDSDLQQDAEYEDVIVLSSTFINHASYVQAYPVLELTLTDVNDKPVLRRLFTPGEYLSKETDVNAGMAADSETKVKLHLAATGIKAAGYRVYIMYPSTS